MKNIKNIKMAAKLIGAGSLLYNNFKYILIISLLLISLINIIFSKSIIIFLF
jgi:hypothetical protein